MRLIIEFQAIDDILVLPVHYNHLIQSMIYSNLEETLATWLHNRGYSYGKRKYKMFTFSRLYGSKYRFNPIRKKLELSSPIKLKIGALDTNILESFVLYLLRKKIIIIDKQECEIISIKIDKPIKTEEPILVKAISPITVYSTLDKPFKNNHRTYFYSPFEEEFEEQILKNLERKAIAYYGSEWTVPPLERGYFKPLKIRKKDKIVVNFKGIWLESWRGIYEMKLPEPYFSIAYDGGVGSRNSQGFGMLEVITNLQTIDKEKKEANK